MGQQALNVNLTSSARNIFKETRSTKRQKLEFKKFKITLQKF